MPPVIVTTGKSKLPGRVNTGKSIAKLKHAGLAQGERSSREAVYKHEVLHARLFDSEPATSMLQFLQIQSAADADNSGYAAVSRIALRSGVRNEPGRDIWGYLTGAVNARPSFWCMSYGKLHC